MQIPTSNQHRTRVRRCAIAMSMAPLLFGATPVLAQSSVTIYGIIDSGVERLTNVGAAGGSVTRMPDQTGTLPSRLGFRGTEDLGGGLKGLFVLEQGLRPDSGGLNQGGRAFGRQAYVGLASGWGTVTLGRIYTMTYLGQGNANTIGPNIYSFGSLDGYLGATRVDNGVGYLGTFSGLTVGATYSLGRDTVNPAPAGGCAGESATDKKACRDVSGMLKYDTANWGAALTSERMYGGAGAGSPLPLSSQTDTRTMLNGYVKFAGATVGGGLVRRKNEGSATTPNSDLYFLGVAYPLGAWLFDAQYSRIDFKNSPNDSSVVALRALYNLSKRSAVYLNVGHVTNKGTAAMSVSGGSIPAAAPAAGVGQTGTMVGLRHVF